MTELQEFEHHMTSMTQSLNAQTLQFRTLIADYCRFESVAAQNRMLPETANWVEQVLKDTGFETRQLAVDGAPNYVYGILQGKSDYTLLLYNHYDVQPETPLDLWQSPPFEVTERDGLLLARGIADNKAEFVARICAIRALRAAGVELPITIKWIIEGEEEIGSVHFDALTRQYTNLLQADGAMWEGPGFTNRGLPRISLGARGLLYVELSVSAMKVDAHSGYAHLLPSGAWRLVNALSSLKDKDGRILIPGFYDDVRAPTEMEQRAFHAKIDPSEEAQFKAEFGLSAFLGDKTGYGYVASVFEPTGNIAGLLSGYTDVGLKTVLPASAMAKMDFRLVPNQRVEDILAKLKAYLKAQGFDDFQVKQLGSGDPVVTPIESPFVQEMISICRDFAGQAPEISPLMPGTLPFLDSMRDNVGLLGISTSGNLFHNGCAAHAPNENIRIADIARAIEFNAFVFSKLGTVR